MNLLKLTILMFLFASGCATAEGLNIVYGVTSIKDIQKNYSASKIGHSSASRIEIYEVDISDLKDKKCLFRNSLKSMTFNVNENGVLVGSERIHNGNVLADIKSCLSKCHVSVEFTIEEKTFFGLDAIRYQNSNTDIVVFFTGSENTTRYSINLKVESESN